MGLDVGKVTIEYLPRPEGLQKDSPRSLLGIWLQKLVAGATAMPLASISEVSWRSRLKPLIRRMSWQRRY